MIVGFYGGLHNNMYLMAGAVASLPGSDHSAVFIRDRCDNWPFSQPSWQDVLGMLPSGRMCRSGHSDAVRPMTWGEWNAWERNHNWSAPPWLYDPLEHLAEPSPPPSLGRRGVRRRDADVVSAYFTRNQHLQWVLTQMKACDILVVCGIVPTITAWASGTPYIIWPHGKDARIAAGLYSMAGDGALANAGETLAVAYRRCIAIGNPQPSLGGGHRGDLSKVLGRDIVHMTTPAEPHARLPFEERREQLNRILGHLGEPPIDTEYAAFCPASLYVEWKGHDRLFDAMASLPDADRAKFTIIFSGWGPDRNTLMAKAKQDGTDAMCRFLPGVVTRPVVHAMASASDFSINEFVMGEYGTAMVESMAFGCPVIMYINDELFLSGGLDVPPVLNARTTADIARTLSAIAAGDCDPEATSAAGLEFIRRNHSPAKLADTILGIAQKEGIQ